FPQLMIDRLAELTDKQKQAIDRNVKAGINRIKGYQLPTGGFGYWPGANEADEWSTNYAGHFLLEAQDKGYAIPTGMLDGWKRYQQRLAQRWSPNQYNWRGGDLIQAYRLYLLAKANAPEMGAM